MPESNARRRVAAAVAFLVQYAKFGIVGILAALCHVSVFSLTMELTSIEPLVANAAAFLAAVNVSFLGHRHWTFRPTAPRPADRRRFELPRFFLVALAGFGLSSIGVYAIVDELHLSYLYAVLFMLTVVPAAVFLLSKHWAFADAGEQAARGAPEGRPEESR